MKKSCKKLGAYKDLCVYLYKQNKTMMTPQEINQALTEYATEDLQIAATNEVMSVTDTKVGVLTICYYTDGYYFHAQGGSTEAEPIGQPAMDFETAKELLMSLYIVEIEA